MFDCFSHTPFNTAKAVQDSLLYTIIVLTGLSLQSTAGMRFSFHEIIDYFINFCYKHKSE
jgi:hypothetical protein